MPPEARKFLNDMLDRATFAMSLMKDKTLDDLVNNRLIRSAVERELMVLGEALYQLHGLHPAIAEQVNAWREIIAFRHVLVHGYEALNMQVIWAVIHDDLAPLVVQLEELLTRK